MPNKIDILASTGVKNTMVINWLKNLKWNRVERRLNRIGLGIEEVEDYAFLLRNNEARNLIFFHSQGAEREAALYSNLRAYFEALERTIP
jgi:hypothetical protein